MQRGQRHEIADLGEHVVVDDGGPGEAVAAVHHPVPHRERCLGQAAGALERGEHPVQRRTVVGDLPLLDQLVRTGGAVDEAALALPDPLDQSRRHHTVGSVF